MMCSNLKVNDFLRFLILCSYYLNNILIFWVNPGHLHKLYGNILERQAVQLDQVSQAENLCLDPWTDVINLFLDDFDLKALFGSMNTVKIAVNNPRRGSRVSMLLLFGPRQHGQKFGMNSFCVVICRRIWCSCNMSWIQGRLSSRAYWKAPFKDMPRCHYSYAVTQKCQVILLWAQ